MDPLFSVTLAVFLGVLTGAAGVHKMASPERFRAALAAYGLLPASFAGVAARIIPVLEVAVALMLLVPISRVWGAALAGGLFAVYGLAIAINLLRGRRDFDCGCSWGGSGRDGEGKIHWGLVARNSVLVAVALAIVLVDPTQSGTWFELLNGLAGGIALGIIWIAFDVLISNHQSMRAGRVS